MRKPIVRVIGQSGNDLVPGWGSALTRVTYSDNDGGEADELEFEFSVSPPFPDSPAEGTRYRLFYAWDASSLRDGGEFTYQSDTLSGDADSGYLMTITARSSDFIDADKSSDTEHFDDMTAGDIFKRLAGKSGKSAIVHPDLASIKIPFRLRWQQSLSGFANELAEEIGGSLKFAGSKMLVPKRNSGQTASGRDMPTITVPFSITQPFEISSEGKGRYKETGTAFFDPLKGVQKLVEGTSIGSASRLLSIHPARTEDEAKHAGKAGADEEARGSVTGSVQCDGMREASAGAPVKLSGFGKSRDALDLVAQSITHEFTFDESGGWLMTVEVANRAAK